MTCFIENKSLHYLSMKTYEIVVESSADLTSALRKKYGLYEDYIKNIIYLPSGEVQADLDF